LTGTTTSAGAIGPDDPLSQPKSITPLERTNGSASFDDVASIGLSESSRGGSDPASPAPPTASIAEWTSNTVAMASVVVVPFAGCIAATILLWQFGWMGWIHLVMMLVGVVVTEWGITVGFHRLLAHRSFDTYRWVRAVWTALGALALQGPPLVWCAVHRAHHHHSDEEGDPHSPHGYGTGWWNCLRGFWHSHTTWLFKSHWVSPELNRYVPDLMKDRLVVWVNRLYYIWVILSLAIPAALGGLLTTATGSGGFWMGVLLGFLWGGLVRVFLVQHITFSINSICHLFGRREYHSDDLSRNNLLCGLLAQGEGWHNNHHAFPTSARHGLRWWQFDMSWLLILAMKQMRLAWNVRVPSPQELQAKRIER